VEDRDLLEVGIADAVASRLGETGELLVRPTASTLKFRGAAADPRRAATELRVDAVLVGVMQASGGRVRVTAQLIRAADGAALWSGEIETEAGKTFTLERTIAHQVAERLMLRTSRQKGQPAAETGDPAVLESYFKGLGYWMRRDRASLDLAIGQFQRALALDPGFAPAHAGLADCYLLLGLYNHLPPAEMLPRARAEAEQALRLNPKLASAHATLGLITQNWERDWAATEQHYRSSIGLAPNYATAHHWYAEFLSVQGRFAESAVQFREAERIDPVSSIIRTDEAQLWYFARDYGRSRAVLAEVLELDPDFQQAHEQLALVYAAQGLDAEAWQEAGRLRECQEPGSLCRLRWTAWLPGRDAAAAADALQRLLREATRRYVPPRALAVAFARQGNRQQALHWLSNAVDAREVGVITMKVDPLLDPVRPDPGFSALLRDLRLD
jgi:TolB-like protein/Tfp pilus assembly protein PilF